jgi:hypothetical protein
VAGTTTTRLLIAVALLAACGDDTPPIELPPEPDCGTKPADSVTSGGCEVVPGTGEEEFTPLAGGEAIDMIHGPQGAFHVWGAFRLKTGHPGHLHYTDIRVVSTDGKILARTPYCPFLESSRVVDGWLEEWGHTVVLKPGLEPADLDGQDAVLRITVDDLGDANLCAPTPPTCRAAACVRVKLHDAP